MENNLFDYIKHAKPTSVDILELIKYNISHKIYAYGDHFKNSKRRYKYMFFFNKVKQYLYSRLINLKIKKTTNAILGLSATYNNFDEKIEDFGIYTERLPFSAKRQRRLAGDFSIWRSTVRLEKDFIFENYFYLTSPTFIKKIESYKKEIKRLILENEYKFLLIPNDVDFFSLIYITVFKELNMPTMMVSHGGMSSLYSEQLDNRTDYFIAIGSKQVEGYIKMGYNKNKYIISGHSFYNKTPLSYRFDFSDILIITKSINGTSPLDKPHLEDRGNIIMYLYAIQNTLKKMGITKVRLRPHPSENPDWYMSFLDSNFFSIDKYAITESLNRASLVIGPTSTMIVDAMAHSVNYTIFEPIIDGKLITGYPVNPPLDGSDSRIPIARTEEELYEILKNKQAIDITMYNEFADPNFDASGIKKIIDDWNY